MDQLLKMNIKFHMNTIQLHEKHIQELQSYLQAIMELQENKVTQENDDAVEIDMIKDGLNNNNTDSYPEFASQNSIWDRIHSAHSSDKKEIIKENNLYEPDTILAPVTEQETIRSDMKQDDIKPVPEIKDTSGAKLNALMKYGPHEQKRIQMNVFQQAMNNIDSIIRVNSDSINDRCSAINLEADRLLEVWLKTH
jgi:hypothetical protein